MAENKKINFEKSLLELEEIVKQLEKGECTLDESIALFEKGTKLAGDCGERLENARQQIVTLSESTRGETQ